MLESCSRITLMHGSICVTPGDAAAHYEVGIANVFEPVMLTRT